MKFGLFFFLLPSIKWQSLNVLLCWMVLKTNLILAEKKHRHAFHLNYTHILKWSLNGLVFSPWCTSFANHLNRFKNKFINYLINLNLANLNLNIIEECWPRKADKSVANIFQLDCIHLAVRWWSILSISIMIKIMLVWILWIINHSWLIGMDKMNKNNNH